MYIHTPCILMTAALPQNVTASTSTNTPTTTTFFLPISTLLPHHSTYLYDVMVTMNGLTSSSSSSSGGPVQMVSFELLHRLQRYRPLVTLSDIIFSATCCYFLANKLCVDDICGAYRLKAVVKMVFVVLRDEPIFRECILDGSVGAAVTLSEDEQVAVGRVIAPMLFPPPSANNNSNSKPSSSSSSSVKSSSSSSLLLHSGGDGEKERDGDQSVATLLAIAAEVSLPPTLLHFYISSHHPLHTIIFF